MYLRRWTNVPVVASHIAGDHLLVPGINFWPVHAWFYSDCKTLETFFCCNNQLRRTKICLFSWQPKCWYHNELCINVTNDADNSSNCMVVIKALRYYNVHTIPLFVKNVHFLYLELIKGQVYLKEKFALLGIFFRLIITLYFIFSTEMYFIFIQWQQFLVHSIINEFLKT